ncbi:hypothetical protein NDU88_003874 [Pleurodeles waltl]|uniref:Uncharacterized protein n=1 Tax=Pleurodeles waltl TaxID=8319 RepID=A0AAV7T6F2_PLEWA|nr:hypothetical protein NDU88_003874 [Pleurodeles waltl]
MLRLLLNSLAPSTQQAYVRAWREFTRSGACRRDDEGDRLEDVVRFIMELVESRQSRITISRKVSELLGTQRQIGVTRDDIDFGRDHLVVRIGSSKTDQQGFGARVI